MSINRDMAKAAERSQQLLGDSTSLVAEFFSRQICDDGGFADHSGDSDLYYSVFGLGGLTALAEQPIPNRCYRYLDNISPADLPDLVHLASYIRCRRTLEMQMDTSLLRDSLNDYRTSDGAFSLSARSDRSTVYSCFLALGAFQDLNRTPPDTESILQSVRSLRLTNGGYSNFHGKDSPSIPATAAALTLRSYLGAPRDEESLEVLWDQYRSGGFAAGDGVNVPDLLSTAVSVHALALNDVDIAPIKEPVLDFTNSLWSGRGGFFGNWFEDSIDCEYTYYGLMTLGHFAHV